jgi:hypothetical protein
VWVLYKDRPDTSKEMGNSCGVVMDDWVRVLGDLGINTQDGIDLTERVGWFMSFSHKQGKPSRIFIENDHWDRTGAGVSGPGKDAGALKRSHT